MLPIAFRQTGAPMEATTTTTTLLREADAAAILNVQVATLRRWRWAGKGPVFRKIGAAVRYERGDIDAFIQAARRSSTSDSDTACDHG